MTKTMRTRAINQVMKNHNYDDSLWGNPVSGKIATIRDFIDDCLFEGSTVKEVASFIESQLEDLVIA
jgi:hypothetical protein